MLFKEKCNELGELGQRILREYNVEINESRGLFLDTLTHGSSQKASFTCEVCGHTWDVMIWSRSCGTGCPHCAKVKGVKKRVQDQKEQIIKNHKSIYDWALDNGDFGKKLIADIDWEENKKHNISVYEVSPGSHKMLYWKCSKCGGQYIKDANNRIRHECPYCKGQTTLKGVNDLETWCNNNPGIGDSIKNEFDIEENLKIGITLDSIRPNSLKYVYFKCTYCGYKWNGQVTRRIKQRCGCPKCRNRSGVSRSFPEMFIYNALNSIISNMEHNYRSSKYLQGLELDICLPDYRMAIEYDSYVFHSNLTDGDFPEDSREATKTRLCSQYNVRLIHSAAYSCNQTF